MQTGMLKTNNLCKPPEWVSSAFIYQIFPDRFHSSGLVDIARQLRLKPWESAPEQQGFHGGDLYGVIEKLDYLQNMGVDCIYLTPIFTSPANHRYHTFDYFRVDPILGGDASLEALIEALHSRGMRIVLDGVFNHCGRGFWPFHNLLENGKDSPYLDWFKVYKWPLRPYSRVGTDCGYECWWNDPALPKFNHSHRPVREYLLSVASYWLEKGIDGWRLDVPEEVPSDFWLEFRQVVKKQNPQAWILGEVWGCAKSWLEGDQFDGVMNYRIGWSTLSWVGGSRLRSGNSNPLYPIKKIDSDGFIDVLQSTFSWYRSEINKSQMNLLDSHDVPRALYTLCEDINALKLALFLLFLQPGAPCIYYGTEVGLCGGKDPLCRETFPWKEKNFPDLELFIKSLADLRNVYLEVFQKGLSWEPIGKDVLHASFSGFHEGVHEDKILINIWINRSRRSSFKIKKSTRECFWKVGRFESTLMYLGPQSAVVMD